MAIVLPIPTILNHFSGASHAGNRRLRILNCGWKGWPSL